MTTAPITVNTTPRQVRGVPVSPLTVLMLINREAGVTPAVNTIAAVDDADPAAVLGAAANLGRRWYDLAEAQSNVHVFALPFDASNAVVNGPAALNALLNPEQRAKLYGVSPYGVDVVHVGQYTGATAAANAIIQRLETVCQDVRVKAAWIADGYTDTGADLGTQTLAEAQAWAVANATRRNGIAVANLASVAGSLEFGSAIALATLARYAGLRGIGAHPFNLADVVAGIGPPAPEFVFDSADATAAAEVLDNTNRMTSLITHDGSHYMWGGKTTWPAGDPRHWWGNLVVQNRIEKRLRRIMESFVALRLSEALLDDIQRAVDEGLNAEFGAFTQRIGVGTPTVAGQQVTVPVETAYYGFIETILAENSIFVQAP